MLSPASPKAYWPALDGLRALSVIAVVWHHARPTGLTSLASTRGYLGVDVFFVISGFLITTLLLRERDAFGRVRLGAFWARRALRLFPLWFAILGGLAVLFQFVAPEARMAAPFFQDLPWNATYTSNFIKGATFLDVSWSLATEEQFYLVWPLLLIVMRGAAVPALAIAGGLSAGVHLGVFDAALRDAIGTDWTQYWALVATLLPLVLGCALGLVLYGRPQDSLPAGLRSSWLPWLSMVALLGIACLPRAVTEGQMRLLAQLAAALVVASCVCAQSPPRALTFRPLRWIGERAYGVYLLHMLCAQGLYAAGPGGDGDRSLLVFLSVLALSMAAAGISYRFIERPFLGLKSRFRPV